MICTLTKGQQEQVLGILGIALRSNIVAGPADILKSVYHTIYDAYLRTKGMTKNDATVYALGMTQFGAEKLASLLKNEESPLRKILQSVSEEDPFSSENLLKYTKEAELRKLLSLRPNNLINIPAAVIREDVQNHLTAIVKAFPPLTKEVQYKRKSLPLSTWNFVVATDKEGNDVNLVQVTEFVNNRLVQDKVSKETDKTIRSGILTDFTIRRFFRKPMDYENFKKSMYKDKEFVTLFRNLSEDTIDLATETASDVVLAYMEDYLNDMLYAINFIQSNYTDYYITDLSDLIENNPSLTEEQKKRFFIYSTELGIRGELDLLAIKPDGSFRVIDIKNTNTGVKPIHAKQASVYDLILSKITGLKSEGENDIVYLNRSIVNPAKQQGRTDVIPYNKISITDFSKSTTKNIEPDVLANEIYLYRSNLLTGYNIIYTEPDAGLTSPFANPWLRANLKKRGGLKMVYDENDELSTKESLEEGLTWLKATFPELADSAIRIIRMVNSNAGGEFFTDSILLYERSNKGVAYHEGWHRFTQLFMTKVEKLSLYNSVKKDTIDFTTRDGRKLNTSTATFMDIEEFLAEEFRKYVASIATYTFPKGNITAKSWFEKIWEALKSIFRFFQGKGTFAYEELFNKVYTGQFNRSNYSRNNVMFDHLNSYYKSSKLGRDVLDNNTFLKMRNFADLSVASYLTFNDGIITDLLTSEGVTETLSNLISESIVELYNSNTQNRAKLAEQIATEQNENIKSDLEALDRVLKIHDDIFNIILEKNEDGEYSNFGDFLRAYFKTSRFATLRQYYTKKADIINPLIDDNLTDEILQTSIASDEDSEKDNKLEDEDEIGGEQGAVYNRSGNEREARKEASDELKDFFEGFPRKLTSNIEDDSFDVEEGLMPKIVNGTESFYKTLNILQGSLTLEMIRARLNTISNYEIFPELIFVKNKLFGTLVDGQLVNEGLFGKMERLTPLVKSGEATEEERRDFENIVSFLQHFVQVMSMRKVPFDTFTAKTNIKVEDGKINVMSPLSTRENLESIVYSILNGFTKGFQLNKEQELKKKGSSAYTSIYEILYKIFSSEQGIIDYAMGTITQDGSILYDPQYKRFYFNAMYIYKQEKYEAYEPTDAVLKEFFKELGINLNDQIFENQNNNESPRRQQILSSFRRIKEIIFLLHQRAVDKAININNSKNSRIHSLVKQWKERKDRALDQSLTGYQKFIANQELNDVELELNRYTHVLFSTNPVDEILFDGGDLNLRRNDRYKLFAANLPIMLELANLEKNYHKRYSSGTMLVTDKLQFSHFLPSQMLVIEMLLNDHINNFSDFSKYSELSHLDPIKNPQNLNSWLIRRMFSDGTKIPNMRIGVSNISQFARISDKIVDIKQTKDLTLGEKLIWDFLMVFSNGSAEIRRLEASDTAYRLALVSGKERREFKKAVDISSVGGFNNANFLHQIGLYIQHAAWKYQYNLNHQTDENYKKKDSLGLFEDMLINTKERIKKFIKDKDGDMNTLMERLERDDVGLFNEMKDEIIKYFEGISIRDADSYKNLLKENLSERDLEMLDELSSDNIKGVSGVLDLAADGLPSDYHLRDFIANDFIMMMEDSLLLFGDTTYYTEPIKRRKVIGNNGSINIMDNALAMAFDALHESSLSKTYQKNKGIVTEKNHKLVKKGVAKELLMDSSLLKDDYLLKNLQLIQKQVWGKNVTIEQLRKENEDTIKLLTSMEAANAAAWITLDMLRTMRMRERTWGENERKEFRRQNLILKGKLGEELTQEEKDFIYNKGKGAYAQLNVSKFAMTGPVYSDEQSPFKPVFDKMGLRVLLPEMDWDNGMRPVFEKMLAQNIDYIVMESGSKGYIPEMIDAFNPDGKTTSGQKELPAVSHAGGFFKAQQNTSKINEKSTFSVQLRSIFYEMLLIQKERGGQVSQKLRNIYNKVIKSMVDYIAINSSIAMKNMGLTPDGTINNKQTFVTYLRNRLLEIGEVDEKLLQLLDDKSTFSEYLEALPFHKNVMDLIAGVLDDNLRKFKLNGTKFYQSPEAGTAIYRAIKSEDKIYRGTIELKWHDLEIDEKGNIVSTTPVECKVNFRKQFEPLLELRHPDGDKIGNSNMSMENKLKRLNEALRDENWVKNNYDSIVFTGVRIPLQDINFNSHIIIKEFLPNTGGDMIILPPEFYVQVGADNDIDTVTASIRYLDKSTGKPVRRPEESYNEILEKINELSAQLEFNDGKIVDNRSYKERLREIRQKFIDDEVFSSEGKTLEQLDAELILKEFDGYSTVDGFTNPKAFLYKLRKNGTATDSINMLAEFIDSINDRREISDPIKKELKALEKKQLKYIQGVTNDIISGIIEFSKLPENYEFLASTDSIAKIKKIATENVSRVKGIPIEDVKLEKRPSLLKAMSYTMNANNHNNNFQIRSMMGSFVKFRSILTLLAYNELVLQKSFIGGSMINILTDKRKIYNRTLRTPLLYKKSSENGVQISIFDEDGNRITKNLSMIISSLIDLFKNDTIFPSLNITWLEAKPLIALMAQGVPLERAILFLNNPIAQLVQKELAELGSDARDKYAIVSVAQKLWGSDIFMEASNPIGRTANNVYRVKTYDNTSGLGRSIIDPYMRRPAKAAEAYLGDKPLSFSEEDLTNFTKDWAAFKNDPSNIDKGMGAFLRANPKYDDFAKDITAYYTTLFEDGDMFYSYYVKALNRVSTKINSQSAVTAAAAIKKARIVSKMGNIDFENKLEKESTHAPFYNDKIVENVLANTMPNILGNKDEYFTKKFKDALNNIIMMTWGTPEDQRKVEMRALSDWMYMLLLNFSPITRTRKVVKDGIETEELVGNFPYEFFEDDINPLLPALKPDNESFRTFLDNFKKDDIEGVTEDEKIHRMYNETLLSNQVNIFSSKYHELRSLRVVAELMSKKTHSIDPKVTSNLQPKDLYNLLSQSYLILNLPANPKDKQVDEILMREEFEKLASFDLDLFPALKAEIAKDPQRIDFYRNVKNITEIREFWKLIQHYLLTQSSHLEKSQGSYSYLISPSILDSRIKQAIDNFNLYLETGGSMFSGKPVEEARKESIDKLIKQWLNFFRDMNNDLRWRFNPYDNGKAKYIPEEGTEEAILGQYSNQEKGLPYLKSQTGKLYSKMDLTDSALRVFKQNLLAKIGVVERVTNNFKIDTLPNQEDELNCSI